MLSDLAIKAAKPKSKQYRLADEKGLYLLIRHSGKLWRFDYRIKGKRKTISFGSYPETTLSSARKKRDEARSMVQDGIDPSEDRQEKNRCRRKQPVTRLRLSPEHGFKRNCSAGQQDTLIRSLNGWNTMCFPSSAAGP